MNDNQRADFDFALSWSSHCANHKDVMYIPDVDFENDILPDGFSEKIRDLKTAETHEETFPAQILLDEGFSQNKVRSFSRKYFNTSFKQQLSLPQLYRFYPRAIAWQGLDTGESDFRPFRLISMNDEEMTADMNQPLAKYFLTLSATKCGESGSATTQPARHIGKIISQRGPGMQVPFEFGDSSFFTEYPFTREDDKPDILFYQQPRLIDHIDSTAQNEIKQLYAELLDQNSKILDLMSSWNSHLPESLSLDKLVGLGMNKEELTANKRLSTFEIHDLNEETTLPFETNSFDDVICSLSFEYLTKPIEVINEIARVIKPGGKFIVTFSERWFPTKAIKLWSQIHPFERIQYVLECFRKNDLFDDLNTYSKRGLPRPEDDKYFDKMKYSDPVYAVWGTVKE